MPKNGNIPQTVFSNGNQGDIVKKASIQEIRNALDALNNIYAANVDNCGNCTFCQTCQTQSCQGCQVCQSCQTTHWIKQCPSKDCDCSDDTGAGGAGSG